MLNKSIPYKNIVMEIKAEDIAFIPEPVLPKGFSFSLFHESSENEWAKIETSVLEFDNTEEAVQYFKRDYLPFLEDLKNRCLFIVNSDGIAVATATAWFSNTKEYGYQPSLHWVAVQPEYQGLGLGKAIIQKATKLFQKLDAGYAVILHTQTCSDTAIIAYLKIGYVFSKTKRVVSLQNGGAEVKISDNDFDEAITVLKEYFSESVIDTIINTAR